MPMILILAVSTVLGFLTGLGVGGGSLLILWLTLVLQQPQELARTINLLFFLPSALICCLFRKKQGILQMRKVLPAILAGTLGAGVFSFIGTRMDPALLRKPFGILLLITGLRELCYRPRKAK